MKSLLARVPAYVTLQKAVGADLLRYRCLDAAELRAGEVVVDVGCGPAYYFDRLPQPLTYHGYDTSQAYIDWARSRFGDRGEFHFGIFDEKAAADIPAPDAILLLGLLHHLSDQECRDLLSLCSRILAPGGRLVSVDPTFHTGQGRVSRWMSENDRGEFVRQPEEYDELAGESFASVESELVSAQGRIPGAYWLMRLAAEPS